MSIIRRRNHEVPSLNTASLPDLIFAILFFFMIVTHMRKVNLKVRYKTPQGTELTHLSRKTNTTYIFIGQPVGTTQAANTAQSLGTVSAGRSRLYPGQRQGGKPRRTICLSPARAAPGPQERRGPTAYGLPQGRPPCPHACR